MQDSLTAAELAEFRARCWRCWRPEGRCLCASVPRIETRTAIDIVQHPRERTHPFGTARLCGLAMPNARVHVALADRDGVLRSRPEVPADAAVLYPHRDAVDLETMPAAELPRHLVVLDGTWAHSRRLYRDNPWLRDLRHVRLTPGEPSRYRIRREPRADYVSTLEAIVAALRILEPGLDRLDELLAAFDRMIDRQVEHTAVAPRVVRFKTRRPRPSRSVPDAIAEPGLLVVYGEASLPGGDRSVPHELLQWTAAPIDGGAPFEAVVRPAGAGPTAEHLGHVGLTPADLAAGESIERVRERFVAFCAQHARRVGAPDRPTPLAAWTASAFGFARELLDLDLPLVGLKAAWCNVQQQGAGVLDEVLAAAGIAAEPVAVRGRAAARLGNALAAARRLRDVYLLSNDSST